MLSYVQGDLFAAPFNSILVHACNTQGTWGNGIALAFRDKFPREYDQYRAHCRAHNSQSLVGTCLLIPGDSYDIACLFTSRSYGRNKDSPAEILVATRKAVLDLVDKNTAGKPLHACRFNSGKFAVPWADTEAILNDLNISMTVYTPA